MRRILHFGVTLAIVLNGAITLFNLAFSVSLLRTGLPVASDFTVFYAGGRLMRDGPRERIYDLRTQAEVEQQVIRETREPFPEWKSGMMPYNYPPHAALAFVPLSFLDFKNASRLWVAFNLLLELYAFLLLFRLTRGWSARERVVFLTTAFALRSWAFNVYFGAFSAIIFVCALRFYQSIKAGRDAFAGVSLAVATLKPQHAFVPAAALAFGRRWRALAAAALALAAPCLAAMALCGWRVWFDYLALLGYLGRHESDFNIFPWMMANLRGVLFIIVGPDYQDAVYRVALVGLAASLVLIFVLWRRGWRPCEWDFDLRMAATLLISMFASPHLNPQDDLLLIGAAALLYGHSRRGDGVDARPFVAVLLAAPSVYIVIALLGLLESTWTWHLLPTFTLHAWLLCCWSPSGSPPRLVK